MIILGLNNDIFQNSKNLPTLTKPNQSSVIINRYNSGTSIVYFERLAFTVTPQSDSLEVRPITWDITESHSKKWVSVNGISEVTIIDHVVGDLVAGVTYNVIVDNVVWDSFTADNNGQISFEYTGIFENEKIFSVRP